MAFGEVGTSLSKIKANSLNLAGTFGFTGTVTGLSDETPLVLISTFTSDGSDATASFTSGIDSTYKEYLFIYNNIHLQTDGADFTFQASTNGGTGYGVTATTVYFGSSHGESGAGGQVSYTTSMDKAQSTDFLPINNDMGSDNDQSASGILRLFNPSSTTFVKNFFHRGSRADAGDYAVDNYSAGYFNTTSAINAIQFKFDSGEIQGGTIDLFGVV